MSFSVTVRLTPMNRQILCIIINFLLATTALAQTNGQALDEVSSSELIDYITRIEVSIGRLKVLAEQAQQTPAADGASLEYRLDQRIIRLLSTVTKLVRATTSLPEDDPDRVLVEKRLHVDLTKTDQILFQRIQSLEERIKTNRENIVSAGEPEKYALTAYGQGMEGLRLGFHASLVDLIENKELLGLPTEELRQQTDALFYKSAEQVSARIELFRTSLRDLKARLALDTNNTGMQSAANLMKREHAIEIGRLEYLLKLMSRLDIDTVLYRSVLLRESSGVSLRMFDGQAIKETLLDGWESARDSLAKNMPDIFLNLLVFILILLAARALSQLVKHLTDLGLNRSSADLSVLLKDILVSASGAMVMLLGILLALAQVGISLGPALAGLGVAGFIMGFALQDTLGNFASGGMILMYRPYDVDDYVEVAGIAGLVKKMTLVSTTIITFDNQTLIIPNSKIWGDVIKNVTAQRTRRVDLIFSISYSDDIEKAERILREVVTSNDMVLKEPEPNIRLHKLGDSSVDFIVRPWTNTVDYWEVYWNITREVKLRFDRDGISIPFPQRDVHIS